MIRRVLAGVLVLLLAAACAIVEVFYLPLRAGSVLVPLSVVAAVAGNLVFTRTMYELTGAVWPAFLPGAVWLAVIGRSAIARPEGDLLITDGGSSTQTAVVNLAFLLLGSLALAFALGTLRPRPRPTQGTPAVLGPSRSSPVEPAAADQPPETAGRT